MICNGYKLPFRQIPQAAILRNNKSALANLDFVSSEIGSLLTKQCISEVTYIPRVVNPLTVALSRSGKKRLVLDCGHINPDLFKFKCCFEDQSVARQLFSQEDHLFSFDIRSAYHHCMVFTGHRTFWDFLGKLMVRQNTLFSTFSHSEFLQLVSFLRNYSKFLSKSGGQKVKRSFYF